jgi:hypothetical protein
MDNDQLTEVVTTYNEYLGRMAEAARHFCEDLVESNYREISGVLPVLIEGMAWVNQALEGFVRLGRVPESQLELYRAMVNSLHESLGNKDYVLLHDQIEYELIPLLDSIRINEMTAN